MGRRVVFVHALLAASLLAAPRDSIELAQNLYNHTDFCRAVDALTPFADSSAPASELLGQSYFMLGQYRKAGEAFEAALALNAPFGNAPSAYYHWLGRAYGRRAETAFPVLAAAYAVKARSNFEKAVALDPANLEAVSDLFEYYLQAPGFLGGGLDKAARMADLMARHDAAEGNFARARLAEERRDYTSAEALLRRSIALTPRQPGRMLDLAQLLARQARYAESDAVFEQAARLAPAAPRVLYQQAATYIRFNRRIDDARRLLTAYLALDLAPGDTPKSDARRLLKQVSGS